MSDHTPSMIEQASVGSGKLKRTLLPPKSKAKVPLLLLWLSSNLKFALFYYYYY